MKPWQIREVACHFRQCIPIPFPNILCPTSLGHPPILLILQRISFAACQLKSSEITTQKFICRKSLKPGIHTCHRSSQAHPGKSIYQFHINFISYQTTLPGVYIEYYWRIVHVILQRPTAVLGFEKMFLFWLEFEQCKVVVPQKQPANRKLTDITKSSLPAVLRLLLPKDQLSSSAHLTNARALRCKGTSNMQGCRVIVLVRLAWQSLTPIITHFTHSVSTAAKPPKKMNLLLTGWLVI